jgi:hypothetical protein
MTKTYNDILNVRLIGYTQPVYMIGIDDVQDLIAYCAKVSNPQFQTDFSHSERLLSYLRQHSHWSPFEMASATMEVTTTRDISRQFLRSVRIDTDFGREDALTGYVCQGTAKALLESMATQIKDTRQRAFTWTGPYGGGKSSLALMLCSLVGPSPALRKKAKSTYKT